MKKRTVFHDILDRRVSADIAYEDDDVMVFRDIHPLALTHLLFIPKKDRDAIPSILDLTQETSHVPGLLIQKAQEFAKTKGINGYKLIFNVGKGGGQTVNYLHLHFLSNQAL